MPGLILWDQVKTHRDAFLVPSKYNTPRCEAAVASKTYVWPGFVLNRDICADRVVWGDWWTRCGSFARRNDNLCGVHAAIRDGTWLKGRWDSGKRRHRAWRMTPGSPSAFFYNERFG